MSGCFRRLGMVLLGVLMSTICVAETPYDCGIKEVAEKKLEQANQHDKGQLKKLRDIAQKKPSEFNCLPTLETISLALNATQFSLSGIAVDLILKQLMKAVCKITDKFIEEVAEQGNLSWDAPYGIGNVGGGLTEDYQEVDFGEITSEHITGNSILSGDLTNRGEATDVKIITGSKREEAEGQALDSPGWFDDL